MNRHDPLGVGHGGRKRRSHRLVVLAGLLLGAYLPFAAPARAADGFVGCADSDGLRDAVAAANSLPGPDTISLKKGCTYKFYSPVPFTDAALVVTDDLVIYGNGAKIVRSSSAAEMRHFDVSGAGTSLELDNVTLQYGKVKSPWAAFPAAGSILVGTGTELTGDKLTVEGNVVKVIAEPGPAAAAGGIFNDGGVVSLTRSSVKRNTIEAAGGGGELVLAGGIATVADGATTLSGTVVKENGVTVIGAQHGAVVGGGFVSSGDLASVAIDDGSFTANTVVFQGGLGAAMSGAAGLAVSGNAAVDGTLVSGNTAKSKQVTGDPLLSGGILNRGALTVDAGIDPDSDDRSELSENELSCPDADCTVRGGAFAQDGPAATAAFQGSVVKDNSATASKGLALGGGLYAGTGTVELDDAVVKRNKATGKAAFGGGIYAAPGVTVAIAVSDIYSNKPQNCTGVLGC